MLIEVVLVAYGSRWNHCSLSPLAVITLTYVAGGRSSGFSDHQTTKGYPLGQRLPIRDQKMIAAIVRMGNPLGLGDEGLSLKYLSKFSYFILSILSYLI